MRMKQYGGYIFFEEGLLIGIPSCIFQVENLDRKYKERDVATLSDMQVRMARMLTRE